MPRAVVYGPKRPQDRHYEALVAGELAAPPPARQQALRAQADQLAAKVAPEAVEPLYLARVADEPGALLAPDKATWWQEAAEQAAAGEKPPAGAVALRDAAAGTATDAKDGFLEKLAKYVPAESITLTLLAFAALVPSGADVWWLVAAGGVANVLYLFGTALVTRKQTPMPRWYFYPLSAGALVLWAIAVIEVVGKEAGIGGTNAEAQKTFVIAVAAFLIPLLDEILTALTEIASEARARSKAAHRQAPPPRPRAEGAGAG